MRKVALTAIAIAIALSAVAHGAAARTGIANSPTSTGLTISEMRFDAGGIDIACRFALDMAMHARTSKSAGSLAGFVDIAISTGLCIEGDVGLLVGGRRVTGPQGPYHITYRSFSGTLPSITSVTFAIENVTMWISTLAGLDCLTNGAVDIQMSTTGGNPATGYRITAQSIFLTGDFLCIVSSMTADATGTLSPSMQISLF